jgi:membrane associated rhomboid family serine protease
VQWHLDGPDLARWQDRFGLVPALTWSAWHASGLDAGRVREAALPLLSHVALPVGLLSVLVNVLALAAFGGHLEARAGGARLLAFCLLASAGAGVATVLAEPHSHAVHSGTSALAAATIAALLVLQPKTQFRWLVPVVVLPVLVRVPAAAAALAWTVLQFEKAQTFVARGTVVPPPLPALAAGAGLGVLLAPLLWRRRRGGSRARQGARARVDR